MKTIKTNFTLWDGIVAVFVLAAILWTGHHLLKNYSNAYNEFLDRGNFHKIEKILEEGTIVEDYCDIFYPSPRGGSETERKTLDFTNLGEITYVKSGWKHDPPVDTESSMYLKDITASIMIWVEWKGKKVGFTVLL